MYQSTAVQVFPVTRFLFFQLHYCLFSKRFLFSVTRIFKVRFSNSSFYVCMLPWCFRVSILVSRESTRFLFFQLQVVFLFEGSIVLYVSVNCCASFSSDKIFSKFFRWQDFYFFSYIIVCLVNVFYFQLQEFLRLGSQILRFMFVCSLDAFESRF